MATTTSFKLGESEAYVLRFMVDQHDRGAAVSIRDICREFGWSSPNAAHNHIRSLTAKGLLEQRGKGKAVRLMPLALRLYSKRQKAAK
jgi:repressor LexA